MCEFTTVICGRCGIAFGVPLGHEAELRKSGRRFYCPNGHELSFKPSEAEKLTKKLAVAEQSLAYSQTAFTSMREQRNHLERRIASYKGQATRRRRERDERRENAAHSSQG